MICWVDALIGFLTGVCLCIVVGLLMSRKWL